MDLFSEEETLERQKIIGTTVAPPLPRRTPLPSPSPDDTERYEVVIIGVRSKFDNMRSYLNTYH